MNNKNNDEILEEEILEEEVGDDVEDTSEVQNESVPLPEVVEEDLEVQGGGGEEVNFSELPHLEKIRMASQQQGVRILEPNKSCKKCYGRGYISVKTYNTPVLGTSGISTGEYKTEELPNPCKCIYRKEDMGKMFVGHPNMNKREIEKFQSKLKKKQKKMSPQMLAEKKRILDKKKEKKKKKRKGKK